MSKKINFSYQGTDYTLEFTRRSIKKMEQGGFIAEQISEKPMTALPELFAGAFIANHPFIKKEKIEDIFDHMTNRKELINTLADMYAEPLNALLDDPEENEGNLNWTVG